ncbi:MAG: LytTR family DNA-binding domain-containing protein, partial [Bacteroidota bacterium]|nr:LytTR family DNA-binding domain-containing protein [Bacteroidota bacterium]
ILPSLLPKMFVSEKWNIKKEIFWNLWILFTIFTGYFFYCRFMGLMKFNFNMVIKLVMAAVLPITVLIITNHNRMLKAHLKLANELTLKLRDNKLIQERIIRFDSDYQKDSLAIKVGLLILIRSANNYIEVYWKEAEEVKKQMIRCSMMRAEALLKEYKFIVKCHRSYIVNINYIEKIEGNLQGYKLFIEKLGFPVPVSKNYAYKLKEVI